MVDEQVGGDPVEPGPEASPRPEGAGPGVDAEEGLLDQIVGQVRILGQAQQVAPQGGVVAPDQRGEGGGVAAADGPHQALVGVLHHGCAGSPLSPSGRLSLLRR